MPRPTDNPKSETIQARVTLELKNALKQYAEDTDTTLSQAITDTINYGILYYYYEKSKNSGND